MAGGKKGKLVLGRCTAEPKGATCEEASTRRTLRGCTAQHKSAIDGERCTTEPVEVGQRTLGSAIDGERCATEPMEVRREDALLKRKAEEEIYKILVAEILRKQPGVAAASEVTQPMLVDLAKAAVPQPLAEGAISEAVSEHQDEDGIKEAVSAEHPEGYEDEAEDDYQDDAEYYEDAEYDDYDYEEEEYDYEEEEYDYEALLEEQRSKVKAVLSSFPEAENLEPKALNDAVDRVLEQSKPEYDNVAAPGKIRLLKEDIKIALDTWKAPPPSIVLNWCPNHTLSAESIRMSEELDKEFLTLYENSEEEQDRERFRAKVRNDLIVKGYVEVDEDYYEKKDEYERQCMQKIEEEWNQQMHFRRYRAAANNE